jgi:hypothetical protein
MLKLKNGFVLFLFLLSPVLFTVYPANAAPMLKELFFQILPETGSGINPGTLSHAGGKAPLMGRDIVIQDIVQDTSHRQKGDVTCISCTLDFSTGPFSRATAPNFFTGFPGYEFGGEGSFRITGGVLGLGHFGDTFSLPVGTVLASGMVSRASMDGDAYLFQHVDVAFQNFSLNPSLGEHFGIPLDASQSGGATIGTAELAQGPPNSFELSTFILYNLMEPGHIYFLSQSVPIQTTFWLFAVGVLALVLWWEQKNSIHQSISRYRKLFRDASLDRW